MKQTILISMKYVFTFFVFIIALSCKKNADGLSESSLSVTSTGPINTITVFSDEDFYATELEEYLLDSTFFGKPFPGVYFPREISFNVRGFENNSFSSFRKTRNILRIVKSDSTSISFLKDKYAYPQTYIELKAKTRQDVLQLLDENKQKIFSYFKKSEIDFLLLSLKKKSLIQDSLLKTMGVEVLIPNDYKKLEQKNNFVRYKKTEKSTIYSQQQSTGRSTSFQSIDFVELMFYKVAFSEKELDKSKILFIIDSTRRVNLVGKTKNDFPRVDPVIGTYITNFEKTNLPNEKEDTYLLDSYWSMSVSQLGGPMLSKIIHDKKEKTIYIADAFMFAPLNPDDSNKNNNKKRDYLRNLEAIYSTFKLKKNE